MWNELWWMWNYRELKRKTWCHGELRTCQIREKRDIGLIDLNVYKLYIINVYWYEDDDLRWILLLYLIIFEFVVYIDLGFLKFNLRKCLIMVFLVNGYVMIGCGEN